MLPLNFSYRPLDSPMQKSGWRKPFGMMIVVEKLRQHLVILIGVIKRAGCQRYGCIGSGDLKQGVPPF
ncbi:hypothetical protein ACC703_38490, partial [Rhizobium ruizarguesonis]